MTDTALQPDTAQTAPTSSSTASQTPPQKESKPQAQTPSQADQAQGQQPQNTQNAQQEQTRRPTRRGRTTSRRNRRPFNFRRLDIYADESVPRVTFETRRGEKYRSHAYLKQDLCLQSDRAQIFFENFYEFLNETLINNTLTYGRKKVSERFAAQVTKDIDDLFTGLENEMQSAIGELKRIANEHHIPEQTQIPSYDNKRNYEIPLHTPHSARFLMLVLLFDEIIARSEGLWLMKLISHQTRSALIQTWERKLRSLIFAIRAKNRTQAGQANQNNQAKRNNTSQQAQQTASQQAEAVDPSQTSAESSKTSGDTGGSTSEPEKNSAGTQDA